MKEINKIKYWCVLFILGFVALTIILPLIKGDNNQKNNKKNLEISTTILNVYSYPYLYENWTVELKTTGTADLKITATSDINYTSEITRWSNKSENYDLKFLEIRCGNETKNYEWQGINCGLGECSVFIANYSCNETTKEISKVLTAKKHILLFNFGGIKAYAYNEVNNTIVNATSSALASTDFPTAMGCAGNSLDADDTSYCGNNLSIDGAEWGYVNSTHFADIPSDSTINNVTICSRFLLTSKIGDNAGDYVEIYGCENSTGNWNCTQVDICTGVTSGCFGTETTRCYDVTVNMSTVARARHVDIRILVYGADTDNNQYPTVDWNYVNLTFTPPDTTAPNWLINASINNSSPAPVTQQVLLYSQWNDNIAVNKYIFSWNATGTNCNTWANETSVAFSSGNWTNTTKSLTNNCTGNTIGFKFWANDTRNNWNDTSMATLIVKDITSPKWIINASVNDSNPSINNQVLLYSQWTDNIALNQYIFSWNGTGASCDTWANESSVAFTTGNWTNTTQTIATACSGKTISFKFFANDTTNNWNVTSTANFTVQTVSETIDVTLTFVPIQFGSLEANAVNRSAQVGNGFPVNVTIETTTNVATNLTLKGWDFAGTGANNFNIGNLTYRNSTGVQTAMTLTYPDPPSYADWLNIPAPVSVKDFRHVYFWLSIPPGQTADEYATNISIKVYTT